MQFSKKVSQYMRLYNLESKDVFFALLTSAGATAAESFAVIFRPANTTNASLSSKASQYVGQRPGLRKLMDELSKDPETDQPKTKAGRPRKDPTPEHVTPAPEIDYTNKDEMLREAWEQYRGATTDAIKAKWYAIIVDLQRMKQEQNTTEEKRVTFYIPLSYDRCEELRQYLTRYYAERDGKPMS